MDSSNVRVVLKEAWSWMPERVLESALDLLTCEIGGVREWVEKNPDLFVHPRDTVDESTLGVHQNWSTNLMFFRTIDFHGRKIYLFEHHVDALCETTAE